MTQEEHFDVASYALGVLDDRDAARFEDHLIGCARCTHELDSFLEVADLLADVDADAVIAAEESRRDGVVLQQMIGEVKHERRRATSRRLYSLAAAVVLVALLSIGALFAGGKWLGQDQQARQTPSAQRASSRIDPLPNTTDGLSIGGPDLVGQVRYGGSDPRTGVQLVVALETKDWGTQISFGVSNIKGPNACRLVAVHTDGTAEPVVSWSVGPTGWGTAANPQALLLQAVTATPPDEIAYLQVQEITAAGTGETLVRVP